MYRWCFLIEPANNNLKQSNNVDFVVGIQINKVQKTLTLQTNLTEFRVTTKKRICQQYENSVVRSIKRPSNTQILN